MYSLFGTFVFYLASFRTGLMPCADVASFWFCVSGSQVTLKLGGATLEYIQDRGQLRHSRADYAENEKSLQRQL